MALAARNSWKVRCQKASSGPRATTMPLSISSSSRKLLGVGDGVLARAGPRRTRRRSSRRPRVGATASCGPPSSALHGQRQFLQQRHGAFRGLAARPLLARPRQPGDDRLVQFGTLFRQAAFVPVDDGQGGEHDRIAGHAADLRPGPHGRQQFGAMLAGRVRLGRIDGAAPAGQEGLDRLVRQRLDAGLGEAGQHGLARGRRPADWSRPAGSRDRPG